ncbi:hypothetical protein [Cellulosimicrobium funkei]|uniref:hypothetical protein n=1 Tax=Cellulosimicrobium funkei TaxID=264251 RepID=UPI003683CAE7
MSDSEFADALLGHFLSWPVVVLVAILVFRVPLSERIRALRKAKVGDNELEFSETLREAEESVDSAIGEPPPATDSGGSRGPSEPRPDKPDPGVDSEADELLRKAEDNPSSSMLIAWERFVREQHELIQILRPSQRRRSPIAIAEELAGRNIVNHQYVAAVSDLRAMRNAIAHGEHVPTPGEAVTYVQLAEELRRFTEGARHRIQQAPRETD